MTEAEKLAEFCTNIVPPKGIANEQTQDVLLSTAVGCEQKAVNNEQKRYKSPSKRISKPKNTSKSKKLAAPMLEKRAKANTTESELVAKRRQEQDYVNGFSSLPSFDPRIPYDDIKQGKLIEPIETFFKGFSMAASSIFYFEEENNDSGNILDCVRDLLSATIAKMEEQPECLICDECGQEFTSRAVHRMHKVAHANGCRFVCKICGKRFAYRFRFMEHIMEHEGREKLFKCDRCPQSFQTNQFLERHRNSKHKEKKSGVHKCEFCGKGFKLMRFLKKHLKEFCKKYRYLTSLLNNPENRNDSRNIKEESDKDEDFQYKSLETLLKEIERSGQNMEKVKTFLGGKKIVREKRGNLGGKKIVREKRGRGASCKMCQKRKCYWKDVETKGEVFCCCACSNVYSSLSKLNNHKVTHFGPQFVCPICNKGFYMKSKYEVHMFVHSGQKPFECNLCSRKFNSKTNLHMHMVTHENVKKYYCNFCQRKFIDIRTLEKHQHLVHNRLVGLITCEFCQKKFQSKTGFTKHLRKEHNANQELRCDRCCKAFVTSQSLIDHITTQCVTKPAAAFKCPQCNEGYTDYKTMLRHMNKQHRQTPTTCPYCFRGYNIRPLYSLHMYKAHGELHCLYCNAAKIKSLAKLKLHVKISHCLERQSQELQWFLEALKRQASDSESEEDEEKPPLMIDEASSAILDEVEMYYCNNCTGWFDSVERLNNHNCHREHRVGDYYVNYG